MRILVVEDEEKIASFVHRGLTEAGFYVVVRPDGDSGYAEAAEHPYDAVVLDIMLPGRDGLSILRQLRQRGRDVPVILLTARAALDERVEGLDLGADDYLTKPFYVEELVARLHAVTRRRDGRPSSLLEAGPVSLDLLSRQVRCGDRALTLTAREFALLEYLVRSPGRVFTRTQILERVWGLDFDPGTNIVDAYIRRLRQRLEEHRGRIETIRGVGYRWRAERSENDR
jgi:two-component system OmpR family response regulator